MLKIEGRLVEHYVDDGYEVCIYDCNDKPVIIIDTYEVLEEASDYVKQIVEGINGQCTLPATNEIASVTCESTKLRIDYKHKTDENFSWDLNKVSADSKYLISEITKFFVLFTLMSK